VWLTGGFRFSVTTGGCCGILLIARNRYGAVASAGCAAVHLRGGCRMCESADAGQLRLLRHEARCGPGPTLLRVVHRPTTQRTGRALHQGGQGSGTLSLMSPSQPARSRRHAAFPGKC
jgi:hypothetical protein